MEQTYAGDPFLVTVAGYDASFASDTDYDDYGVVYNDRSQVLLFNRTTTNVPCFHTAHSQYCHTATLCWESCLDRCFGGSGRLLQSNIASCCCEADKGKKNAVVIAHLYFTVDCAPPCLQYFLSLQLLRVHRQLALQQHKRERQHRRFPSFIVEQLLGFATTLTMFGDLRGGIMVRTDSDQAGTTGEGKAVDFSINAASTVWVCR